VYVGYDIVRTMAVDFNELKPLSEEEKISVRKSIGISKDVIVLRTYTGVFGEEIGSTKTSYLQPLVTHTVVLALQ